MEFVEESFDESEKSQWCCLVSEMFGSILDADEIAAYNNRLRALNSTGEDKWLQASRLMEEILDGVESRAIEDQFGDKSNDEDHSVREAIISMIVDEYPDLTLSREVVASVLQKNNLDYDSTCREIVTMHTVSAQDAMVDVVIGILGKADKFSRIDIRRALKSVGYDTELAIQKLQSNSKTRSDVLSEKSKGSKPNISKRKVSENTSFASVLQKGIQCLDQGDSKTSGTVGACGQPDAQMQSSSTAAIGEHNPLESDTKTVAEWREIAKRERNCMLSEFRRACQIRKHQTGRGLAFANFVGARGLEAKERFLKAQWMVDLSEFNENNGVNHVQMGNWETPMRLRVIKFPKDQRRSVNIVRIDMHRVRVSFAEEVVDVVMEYCSKISSHDRKFDEIVFVVGRGVHSKHGVVRLKPAVASKLQAMGKRISVNDGEVIVHSY